MVRLLFDPQYSSSGGGAGLALRATRLPQNEDVLSILYKESAHHIDDLRRK